MCGGFSLIKDLYKTTIFELAEWRSNNIPKGSKLNIKNIIPLRIINKEPSAELRIDQKDSDTLPPYSLLDKILYGLIEQNLSKDEIAKQLDIDISLVTDIQNKIFRNEFKRSQAAVGPKISIKSLNSERKYPITVSSF